MIPFHTKIFLFKDIIYFASEKTKQKDLKNKSFPDESNLKTSRKKANINIGNDSETPRIIFNGKDIENKEYFTYEKKQKLSEKNQQIILHQEIENLKVLLKDKNEIFLLECIQEVITNNSNKEINEISSKIKFSDNSFEFLYSLRYIIEKLINLKEGLNQLIVVEKFIELNKVILPLNTDILSKNSTLDIIISSLY